MIPAVVYGVKSSPDEKESVADQQRIARAAIEREGGRDVIDVFGEPNQSGYRKERGPELEAAMECAINAAVEHGEAELWVWHSSRLARGDGRKGRRSIAKIVHDLLYEDVIVRSATDPEMVSPMLAGIGSKTANQYSVDLGTWTKAGIERSKAAGKPYGPIPFGYMTQNELDANGQPVVIRGRVVTKRVMHPSLGPIVVKVFERVADGQSSGEVARWLNGQVITTTKGNPWTAASVAKIVENDAYAGGKNHPALLSADLFDAAQKGLRRADPVAKQARKGGRPRRADADLRGVAFCHRCDASMYAMDERGRLVYRCSNKKKATGLCHAPDIPGDLIERHVRNHLHSFTASVEEWLADQVKDRDRERREREKLLDQQRAALAKLDAKREKRMEELEKLDLDSPKGKIAVELVERIDLERAVQDSRIVSAETVLAEWDAAPSMDDELEFYSEVLDFVQGRLSNAPEQSFNERIASVLEGLWCELDGDRLVVQFALRAQPKKMQALPTVSRVKPRTKPPST
jgi:DNA invertase Pin-like site-specific DNA recombinase